MNRTARTQPGRPVFSALSTYVQTVESDSSFPGKHTNHALIHISIPKDFQVPGSCTHVAHVQRAHGHIQVVVTLIKPWVEHHLPNITPTAWFHHPVKLETGNRVL